jgi:hypothetical protein
MAHGQIRHHRDVQVEAAFAQHLLEVEAMLRWLIGAAVGLLPSLETAEADPRKLLQGSAQPPVGQHALDPVRSLAHVLQHQDGPLQRRQMG